MSIPRQSANAQNLAFDVLAIFAPLAIGFAVLGYIFWPGVFTPDTVMQFTQAVGYEPLSDIHPVTMALLMRWFTWSDPKFIGYFAFQLVLVAALITIITLIIKYFFVPMRRLTMTLLALALAFLPASGLLNMMVWKDIPATWLLSTQAFAVAAFAHQVVRNRSANGRYVCFTIACFCGGSAIHFRHNAFSVAYTLMGLALAFAAFDLLRSKRIDSQQAWGVMMLGFLLFVGLVSLRPWLKTAFIDDPSNRQTIVEKQDITAVIVRNDFWLAYYRGMPLSSDQEIGLAQTVDLEKQKRQISFDNSFYQMPTNYLSGNPTADRDFIQFALGILKEHPFYWLKAKFFYTLALISSYKGYQVPLPVDNHETVGGFDLNPDPALQRQREVFRMLMGREIPFPYIRLAFWTFWPLVLAFLALIAMAGYQYARGNLSLPDLAILSVPILATLSLWLPMIIVSSPNDFRYFWSTWHFCLLFFVILWSRLKSREELCASL